MIKRLSQALASFVLMFVLMTVAVSFGHATVSSADSGAPVIAVDAGVAPDAASSPATPAPTVHDPMTDPSGYISELEAAKKSGWPLFVLVGVYGLCELLAAGGKTGGKLAWLGKGRISVVIGGAAALATSAINALAAGGTWMAVGAAALFSLLLYVHTAGTDPAKA